MIFFNLIKKDKETSQIVLLPDVTFKIRKKGEEGFIFGRRVRGSFDIRKLDGTRITEISYKKLRLLEKRKPLLVAYV